MFPHLFRLTRFAVWIPVVGSLTAALVVIGFGGREAFPLIIRLLQRIDRNSFKEVAVKLLENIDLILIGVVFLLISLGLFELFIDENAPLPSFLAVHNFDDLVNQLLKVIGIALAVQFLAKLVNFPGKVNILYIGLSIALVIAAIAIFIRAKAKIAKG